MLTIGQITAVIGLLLAFGVPQPTVTHIQAILNKTIPAATSTVLSVTVVPQTTPNVMVQSIPTEAAAPIIYPKVQNMVTFSGWDGSKVVTSASTTISTGTPNTPIQIYDTPYNHLIMDTTTDGNGDYVFNVINYGQGNLNYVIKVPALNYSQTVNMLVTPAST